MRCSHSYFLFAAFPMEEKKTSKFKNMIGTESASIILIKYFGFVCCDTIGKKTWLQNILSLPFSKVSKTPLPAATLWGNSNKCRNDCPYSKEEGAERCTLRLTRSCSHQANSQSINFQTSSVDISALGFSHYQPVCLLHALEAFLRDFPGLQSFLDLEQTLDGGTCVSFWTCFTQDLECMVFICIITILIAMDDLYLFKPHICLTPELGSLITIVWSLLLITVKWVNKWMNNSPAVRFAEIGFYADFI